MSNPLHGLRRNPPPTEATPDRPETQRPANRTRLLPFLPWLIGSLALVLFVLLFGQRLLPAQSVELETVVTRERAGTGISSAPAAADPYAGEILFQASGWFEADPYPFRATALASGVVSEVHVLEGRSVTRGEPIVTLIREDSELRGEAAAASLEAAKAALEAARSDHALSLAREESMRREIDVAEARRSELADLAKRTRELGPEVISEQDITQAQLRLRTQEATIAALEARLLEQEIDSERLAGFLRVREGEYAAALVRLREARLELERMVVRAPVDGIIQRLEAAPGQKKVLMADAPESATVALLFRPDQLQARIDVPLAEAHALRAGQAVLLESEFLPRETLRGRVSRIVGEADLQRNTLQAKVAIEDPPPGLRPEILCRARFLDTALGGEEAGPSLSSRRAGKGLEVLVPGPALFAERDKAASVWVVDETGRRLEKRSLRLGESHAGGYIPVREGLRPGDRVVMNPLPDLREGQRIRQP
jgi:RND family efflux transporter MFP subunit